MTITRALCSILPRLRIMGTLEVFSNTPIIGILGVRMCCFAHPICKCPVQILLTYLLTRGHLWSFVPFRQDPPTLEVFPGTNNLETFECTLRFRSAFNYATLDFTGISQSSSCQFGI